MQSIPPTPKPPDITGLVLCGGAAVRLGGTDKGLVSFHGKPLVDIALDRLASQVGSLMISANRNISAYESRGHLVLKDPPLQDQGPNYEGPLAGILAGLRAVQTPWLAVIPCDCPYFPLDLVSQLAAASEDPSQPRAVEGHPSFSLLPASRLNALEQFLQHGHRKLGQWLAENHAATLRAQPANAFRNLNTPQDLAPELG